MPDDTLRAQVFETILEVAEEEDLQVDEVKDTDALVDDLGFGSLEIAQVIANLEHELGVDPFEETPITEIRTAGDLVRAYEKVIVR